MAESLAGALAGERLRIVGGLIRILGDWELAEDCLQDAAERALDRWPRTGIPDSPAAWLTTTARRRALDVLRRRAVELTKLQEVTAMDTGPEGDPGQTDPYGAFYADDELRLIFTCCHPALPLAGQVALTLKTVAGLSVREVAQALMVGEATMSQRLLRTRNKIAHAAIPFRVPPPDRLADRTAGVLAVIYLVFNEGYLATEGAALRTDLAAEAIRLAGVLCRLLPDDDEAAGLRALLLLQHARRDARVAADGQLITMDEQDRSRWDRAMINDGLTTLLAARSGGRPAGRYRLQAEIAAVHATAGTAAETDWAQVVWGYDLLLQVQPSPVIALNRAVAIGFRDGPAAGLLAVDRIAGLDEYPLVPAIRADLLRRSGRIVEALAEYRVALTLAGNDGRRRHLERRIAELGP